MARMRILAACLAAFGALLASGCAGLPAPAEPTSVDHGILIARAHVNGAVLWFLRDTAARARVLQLDDNGNAIPGKVAVSGLRTKGGSVVFLDLPPGRYALDAVSFPARGVTYEVAISCAQARRNDVVLEPGGAAFLGDLTLDGVFPEFDVAVDRALTVLGHWLTPFLSRPVLPRDVILRTFDRGPKAEGAALLDARAALKGTDWERAVVARLEVLGTPEPAPTRGLRERQVPLQEEPLFSWRDTLEWGPPRRFTRGLVWDRPKGGAQIAVFFTSAAAPGFRGYDEAVREMRAAAGGIDDPAAVYEVRVGTWTGLGARTTSYRYPEGTLVGSETRVVVTETVLVDYPRGMYTARFSADRAAFRALQPAFRAFLLHLELGPPPPKKKREDDSLPLMPL